MPPSLAAASNTLRASTSSSIGFHRQVPLGAALGPLQELLGGTLVADSEADARRSVLT